MQPGGGGDILQQHLSAMAEIQHHMPANVAGMVAHDLKAAIAAQTWQGCAVQQQPVALVPVEIGDDIPASREHKAIGTCPATQGVVALLTFQPVAPAGTAQPAPASAKGLKEELTELKELFDGQLISQAEYDAQRAVILKKHGMGQ